MAIQRRNPPKQLSNLKLLECENAKKNSKEALLAGTAHRKCLK